MTIAFLIKPADGEVTSGDAVVVREDPDVTLISVIDVLGHGPLAADIAAIAVKFLRTIPILPATRATALMHGLHDALRGTRGAAAVIVLLRGHDLDACGVGNVETRVVGSHLPILPTPGIVGGRVGTLREASGKLGFGDRLVCWSDGISTRVALDSVRHLEPRDACVRIMADHRRSHDDATVLVADTGPRQRAATRSGPAPA